MEIEQLPVVSFLEEEKQQKSLKRKREKEAKKKEGPTLKPKKVKVNYLERENQAEGPAAGFGSAVATLLSKDVDTILPDVVPEYKEKNDEEKQLARKLKQERIEKKMLLEKSHVILTYSNENWEREKKYKKIATAGVVKLFNAVKIFQRERDIINPKKEWKPKHKKDKKDLPKATPDTKEKFLKLLKEPSADVAKTK